MSTHFADWWQLRTLPSSFPPTNFSYDWLMECDKALAKERPSNPDHVERQDSNIPVAFRQLTAIAFLCASCLSCLSLPFPHWRIHQRAETVPKSSVVCSTYLHIIQFQDALWFQTTLRSRFTPNEGKYLQSHQPRLKLLQLSLSLSCDIMICFRS